MRTLFQRVEWTVLWRKGGFIVAQRSIEHCNERKIVTEC
ncbi:hypothetical protein SDC9_174898 [bioreactor metagenome]|uniref:Uncharacterized protein n=1 Tax=bioreactor metagenome TaxID=1076179 RepID=A0A645GTT8_9ZZZZ